MSPDFTRESLLLLQVPHFNGTSHMTHLGLGDSSPLWNDFEIVIRPDAEDGIILYNGNDDDGESFWRIAGCPDYC